MTIFLYKKQCCVQEWNNLLWQLVKILIIIYYKIKMDSCPEMNACTIIRKAVEAAATMRGGTYGTEIRTFIYTLEDRELSD